MNSAIKRLPLPVYAVSVFVVLLLLPGLTRLSAQEYQLERILAGDPQTGHLFGAAVSISGNWAIVGAMNDDDDYTNAGAAYIFRKEGGHWSRFQKITAGATLGEANAFFGMSVAISGDRAIIGAFQDDGAQTNTGSAYLYRFNGSDWQFEQKLEDANGSANDEFGGAVAISGNRALVAARYEDTQGTDAGAVFAYSLSGATWTLDATLTVDEPATAMQFGNAVAIHGDIAVIAAYGDDANGSNAGAAYIFEHSGSWQEVARLTASDAGANDQFGVWTAVNGNMAVIGARYDDDSNTDAGAAYVFELQGAAWNQSAKLRASDGEVNDQFGTVLSVSGDRVLVGAPSHDGPAANTGAAYLFRRQNGVWAQTHKFESTDPDEHDFFANALAMDNEHMIFGAHGNDEGATSAGAAYLAVDPCCSPWQQKPDVLFYDGKVAIGECLDDVNLHIGGADDLVTLRVGNSVPTTHETRITDDKNNGNVQLRMAGSDYVRYGASGLDDQGVAIIETGDNGNEPLLFRQKSNTAGVTERARMAANGYWGFGVTSPAYRIDLPNVGDYEGWGRANDWKTYSSIRWKENVQTLDNALARLRLLRGVEFDWKKEQGGAHAIGFIAEEVAEVFPEVVARERDSEYISGMSYQALVPVLVEALKEMDRQLVFLLERSAGIEDNRREIEALKAELRALRGQTSSSGSENKEAVPQLFQNAPNPFNQSSRIRYYVPAGTTNAELVVATPDGREVLRFALANPGYGHVEIPGNDLAAGVYIYSLVIESDAVLSRKMILMD